MSLVNQLLPPRVRGPFWFILSCVAFAGLWVMIRLVSQELHPFTGVVWRYFMGLIWLAPMILLNPGLIRLERAPVHVRRAASGVIATFATFYAVANAPLATVLSINYTAPLFATIGAVMFLGERIRAVRVTALAIGFAGMLLVLRPGTAPLDWGIGAAVVSALSTAFSLVAIKKLTGSDDPRAVAAWSFILTLPVSFVIVLALGLWEWPKAHLWPLLVALGACAAAGQMALAQAFQAAEASAVMPYDFVRFGLITLAGVLLFGERYDAMTLVGGAVILMSTIVLALRERDVGRDVGTRPSDN